MSSPPSNHSVYIDPSSAAYYQDRLFDISDVRLNRDDTLLPFLNLKTRLEETGAQVHTADRLFTQNIAGSTADYYSLGVLDNYTQLTGRQGVRLRAFVVFEPPVVDPRPYRALPALTRAFDEVYVHNTSGDGFSLDGVDQSRLRKLYWPQPRADVIEQYWCRSDRMSRIVVINGNHRPRRVPNELYSKRIEAMAELAQLNIVDLYGRGWARWWSRASMWWPYWKHRKTLMSIYKGACESKYDVLSQYKFSLCFENMAMEGYITEKIFDCFYAGTIPLYLGAKDISALIPPSTYVDCRKFKSWSEMCNAVMKFTPSEITEMRSAGREFLRSEHGLKFYDSLNHVFFAN